MNEAVNLIASRLVGHVQKMDLLRYVSFSYHPNNIPEDLMKYVNVKHGEFYQPTPEELEKCKIVATTLINAAR